MFEKVIIEESLMMGPEGLFQTSLLEPAILVSTSMDFLVITWSSAARDLQLRLQEALC